MEASRNKSRLLVHILLMLMIPDLIYSLSYPIFTSKRFGKVAASHLPALIPVTFSAADFEVPDYDDNYTPFAHMGENEKYSLAPIYEYDEDLPDRDSFVDFEEDPNEERNSPYGRETWFGEGEKDGNAPYIRNVMLPEMDQDPEPNEPDSKIVYGKVVEFSPDYEDNERDRTWYYGVPIYEEKESARGRKDDSVRELESLTKKMKAEEERALNLRNEELVPLLEDEILRNQLQKQMNRSGRKNNIPLRELLKVNEKRFYSPEKSSARTGTRQNYHVKAKDSDRKNKTEGPASIPKAKKSLTGQKEYVLPRPASPVRKPLKRGIYRRSTQKSDVYGAIKKLLAMEEGLQKESRPRIQKRFVLSEDQLTSQLSGLKRIAV